MSYTEAELTAAFESRLEDVQRKERLWTGGKAPQDGVQGFLRNTATSVQRLACCAALLGATHQSRTWFGQAARYYLESIEAARVRRDICARGVWESEPRRATQALTCALVSHDEERVADAASVALGMDEYYLDVFTDKYTDFPASYYNAMARAAVAVDDPCTAERIDGLRGGVDRLTDPSEYWAAIPEFYWAIIDADEPTAEQHLNELFEYYDDDPTDPARYMLHQVAALLRLAHRHDLNLTVDSPRVPETLLQESIPDDDVRLDIDGDLTDLRVTSRTGRFELERDEDGTPVIAGYMYHVGDAEVQAADVPEREAGRLLSEEWVEAALNEAEWRDHYDDLVAAANEAFADGTLLRKLVVLQDRVDGPTFDESLAELPIDKIDLRKGAGRRN